MTHIINRHLLYS